jgi:hypothetical protein
LAGTLAQTAEETGWDETFLSRIAALDLSDEQFAFVQDFAIEFYERLMWLLAFELRERIFGLVRAGLTGHAELLEGGDEKARALAAEIWLPPALGEELLTEALTKGVRDLSAELDKGIPDA